jgi:hypothetical protein
MIVLKSGDTFLKAIGVSPNELQGKVKGEGFLLLKESLQAAELFGSIHKSSGAVYLILIFPKGGSGA